MEYQIKEYNIGIKYRTKLTDKLAALCALCNLITKKTSLCFSIVAKILAERSFPVWGVFDFLLFFR